MEEIGYWLQSEDAHQNNCNENSFFISYVEKSLLEMCFLTGNNLLMFDYMFLFFFPSKPRKS